jgi:hypothetical protein
MASDIPSDRIDAAVASPVPRPLLRGGDLQAAVYGSLLVTTLVAAQARHDASADFIVFTLVVSVGVFWLMEVWSKVVTLRVEGPISVAETGAVARHAAPMLAAAILPALVLASHNLGPVDVEQAINLALAACVVQLFLWGLAVGRALGRGWPAALAVAIVDCGLGLLLVALKVLFIH